MRDFQAIQTVEELVSALEGSTVLKVVPTSNGMAFECCSLAGEAFSVVLSNTLETKAKDGEVHIRPVLSFKFSSGEQHDQARR